MKKTSYNIPDYGKFNKSIDLCWFGREVGSTPDQSGKRSKEMAGGEKEEEGEKTREKRRKE